MAKKKSSKQTVKSKPVNKSAMLREFLRENPELSYQDAIIKFEARGMNMSSAQFYSTRRALQDKQQQSGKKKSRRKTVPARPTVSSAKSAPATCVADLKTSSEIYGEQLNAGAGTRPPSMREILRARKILDLAYMEAWNLLGEDYNQVDEVVRDIQGHHNPQPV